MNSTRDEQILALIDRLSHDIGLAHKLSLTQRPNCSRWQSLSFRRSFMRSRTKSFGSLPSPSRRLKNSPQLPIHLR
jgi:hypothetical protein